MYCNSMYINFPCVLYCNKNKRKDISQGIACGIRLTSAGVYPLMEINKKEISIVCNAIEFFNSMNSVQSWLILQFP